MKKLIVILFTATTFSAFSQPLSELDSSEYFDFWVGEWKVSWDEGNGVEMLGTNTITKSLDGKVLQEHFRITKGKNAGFKGTSISVYQPRYNRWKQAWADNQGGYYDFTGRFDGNKRIFQTKIFERGDQRIQQRMVFYDIKKDHMTWDWELSTDGGETWQLQWKIYYDRS